MVLAQTDKRINGTRRSPETDAHTDWQLISDKGAKWKKDTHSKEITYLNLVAKTTNFCTKTEETLILG